MTDNTGAPGEPDYSKMEAAARASAADAAVVGASQAASAGVPPMAWSESYWDQIARNMTAHRSMRWLAFVVVGVLCAMYLLALLGVLLTLFDGKLLAALAAASNNLNWHLLVLAGVALVVFAAIPLSLAMALVRMISDKEPGESGSEIKVPTAELAKTLVDLIKSATGKG